MSADALNTSFGLAYRGNKFFWELVASLIVLFQLTARDLWLTALNFALPYRRTGKVIAYGKPGYAGMWPDYRAPLPSDSRSPCPALNTLANHGILPRNGRQIRYTMFVEAIQHAYNLSPTLAQQLTSSGYVLDQGRGWVDLHDLNALNVVQHDASFTRPDIAYCPDQSYPHSQMVDRFLSHASQVFKVTDKDSSVKPPATKLTVADIAYYSGLRRAECKATNGQYSLSRNFLHEFFGSGNGALMYSIFGGNVDDLKIWLTEERFPDSWEPKARWAKGHTISFAQKTSIQIEFNIFEDQALRKGDELLSDQTTAMGPSSFASALAQEKKSLNGIGTNAGARVDTTIGYGVNGTTADGGASTTWIPSIRD